MALDGIGTSPFGTPPIEPSRPVVDRSARDRSTHGSTESGVNGSGARLSGDARAAFDADLQAMLGDATSTARAASVTGDIRRTGNSGITRAGEQADTYSRSRTTPSTYTAKGQLAESLSKPSSVLATPVSGATLASQPTAIPAGTETPAPKATADSAQAAATADSAQAAVAVKTPGQLSQAEQEQVSKLQQRDQEVRTHEQAHQATGGEHAGGISYTYQRGPDNRQYAVGGSVPIDVSPVADDPEATIQKAEKVRSAAMAPASPSGQDQQVAARASQMASKARAEQAEKQFNPEKDDAVLGKAGGIGKAGDIGEARDIGSSQNTAVSKPDAEKAAASGITAMAGSAINDAVGNTAAPVRREAPATSVKNGLAASMVPPAATTPPQDLPRPTESTDAMTPEGRASSTLEAAYSPAAQANRAAAATISSLDTLTTASGSVHGNATVLNNQAQTRALSRASAAYARVHGESGLALPNTGISMTV